MRILIADDDPVLRHALRAHLERWGYEVVECPDGASAWHALRESPVPPLAIMDWNMPGVDGPALCQELRLTPALSAMYVILLTSNASKKDIVTGLESGADDYIVKPFDWDELRARIRIGSRIVGLQQVLGARVEELQQALSNVRKLSGLLPICAY
jgi:sigma-B regulation protein RsbU (phosphoserine phosphatase)